MGFTPWELSVLLRSAGYFYSEAVMWAGYPGKEQGGDWFLPESILDVTLLSRRLR